MIESLETRFLLSFSAPVSYNIGTQSDGFVPNAAPINVVSGDFNGDGKLDLIVSHKADNSIYFLKGNGDGTFQPAVQTAIGEAIEGRVFAGDFNNDGKLDLFLPGGSSQAIILLGNGDGTFKPRIDSSSFWAPGYYARGWTVGDFNGDGKLDVASTLPSNTSDSGLYTVLLGNGDGTFKAGIVGPSGLLHYSRWATTGDFNHDGKLDLAIADGQGTSGQTGTVELTVLFGNGDGTFTLGGHYASPQLPDGTNTTATANPEDVVVADVNGDGIPDAIESDYDNTINVFLGNGDGTFQAARSFSPGNYPRDVVPVDVNGDGKIDLVVTNVGINQGGALFSQEGAEPGSVAVLLGNGDGTFQPPITYSPSAYPGWAVVKDFNGDGAPDIAVTQVLDGHSVKVMLNQPASSNLPPTFAQSPNASPATVTGKTTALSALGADDGGESNLTYTWATVGSVPASVAFSINGTNAAKNTTATFTKAGTYVFQCAATDAAGLSIIDLATVVVSQTLTSITVAPSTATAAVNSTHSFAATAIDQFGSSIPSQTFTWSITGSGNLIDTKGNVTLGATPGSYTVTASISGIKGTAGVTAESFAVASGSTLDINLSAAGPVTVSASGANIITSQNGVQITYGGITGVTVTDTASGDALNFNGPLTFPFSFVNCGSSIVNVNSGALDFAAVSGGSVNLGTLSVANGASAMITAATAPSPTTLAVNFLSIAATGRLDVTNNEIRINYGSGRDPISSIFGWIKSGFASSAWNGVGIISTTAQTHPNYGLGYADAGDVSNPAGLPGGQIEILYTLLGDTNLDGSVNATDFGVVASSFGRFVSGWDAGDFNYDSVCNAIDFSALAGNFGQGSQIAAPALLPANATPASTVATTVTTVTKNARVTSSAARRQSNTRHG